MVNKELLLEHILKSDLTATEKRYLEKLIDSVKWISVKERLPEKETPNCTVDVLVTDGTHINIGYYDYIDGMWWTLEDCFYFHVTHWMPLPELPENNKEVL